jgi:anti-sigma factor RsiW
MKRLRTLALPRRHPRSVVLCRYLEGELDTEGRRALESHLRDCSRCRREFASLANTVRALGSLEPDTPPGLADSIIAALRAEQPETIGSTSRAPNATGLPALTVVRSAGPPPTSSRFLNAWPQEARAAFRWCLQRPQLRLTVPIALIAGVVLTMVNMGGMLMHGTIDLRVCMSCALDFLVPFVALNLGLLMLLRLPRRRRP